MECGGYWVTVSTIGAPTTQEGQEAGSSPTLVYPRTLRPLRTPVPQCGAMNTVGKEKSRIPSTRAFGSLVTERQQKRLGDASTLDGVQPSRPPVHILPRVLENHAEGYVVRAD